MAIFTINPEPTGPKPPAPPAAPKVVNHHILEAHMNNSKPLPPPAPTTSVMNEKLPGVLIGIIAGLLIGILGLVIMQSPTFSDDQTQEELNAYKQCKSLGGTWVQLGTNHFICDEVHVICDEVHVEKVK